jgi:hypothetical protein
MISYRANLFESLNKHLGGFRLGDIFENSGNSHHSLFVYSHNVSNKAIFIRQDHSQDVMEIDLKEIKEESLKNHNLKFVRHGDYQGIKVGDQYTLNELNYFVIGLGLNESEVEKLYLSLGKMINITEKNTVSVAREGIEFATLPTKKTANLFDSINKHLQTQVPKEPQAGDIFWNKHSEKICICYAPKNRFWYRWAIISGNVRVDHQDYNSDLEGFTYLGNIFKIRPEGEKFKKEGFDACGFEDSSNEVLDWVRRTGIENVTGQGIIQFIKDTDKIIWKNSSSGDIQEP